MSKHTHALLLAPCFSLQATAQTASAPAASTSGNKPASSTSVPDNKLAAGSKTEGASKPTAKDHAWDLLLSGTKENSTAKRAIAVRVLSLLTGETRAVTLASYALADTEPPVVLAAAHSLLTLKNATAYQVYYEILAGKRKGSKGLVAGELDTLKDPKKMALLGFQEGIGFVPFAGIGYTAIRTIAKDDSSPVRAAAARVLADDTDTATRGRTDPGGW
jgi:hypothetical protein